MLLSKNILHSPHYSADRWGSEVYVECFNQLSRALHAHLLDFSQCICRLAICMTLNRNIQV